MEADSENHRSGVNKYLSNQTIMLIEKCIMPNLAEEKEKEIGFSEAVHETVVFMKNKRNWLIKEGGIASE